MIICETNFATCTRTTVYLTSLNVLLVEMEGRLRFAQQYEVLKSGILTHLAIRPLCLCVPIAPS